MPRKRTGSTYKHGDHFDIRITLPDGSRSNSVCLPGLTEEQARAKALELTNDARDTDTPRARPCFEATNSARLRQKIRALAQECGGLEDFLDIVAWALEVGEARPTPAHVARIDEPLPTKLECTDCGRPVGRHNLRPSAARARRGPLRCASCASKAAWAAHRGTTMNPPARKPIATSDHNAT